MMMTAESIEPVRKTVTVKAGQEKAFRVFTEKTNAWWPRTHHIGKSPLKEVILEDKPGGRWYATHEDGSETNTGKVRVWDPFGRVVLAWQLTADWQFDPAFETEVEVTFTPQGPDCTVVELVHRNLERYGAAAPAVRQSVGSPGGWSGIMEDFAKAAEADGN